VENNDDQELKPEELFEEIGQQLVVLGVAIGSSLKVTARESPEKAIEIENGIRLLMKMIGYKKLHPQAQLLLDVMYSALKVEKDGE
jgi:hypothetical protein